MNTSSNESTGAVDVLAVMRELADLALNSGGRRGEDEDDNEPAIALYERSVKVRAAVAELMEASGDAVAIYGAGALKGSALQAFWASKYNCEPSPAKIQRAVRARLVAALARAGSAP